MTLESFNRMSSRFYNWNRDPQDGSFVETGMEPEIEDRSSVTSRDEATERGNLTSTVEHSDLAPGGLYRG